MSAGGYVAVKSEDDDDDAVLIESTPVELQDARPMVGQNAQANREHHYTTQPAYGGDGVSRLGEPQISQMSRSASMHSESRGPEVEYGFLHKRRRTMHGGNSVGTRESEYEEAGTVVYEYEPDYDTASVVSEASYSGDQQRTLAEVLNYCQRPVGFSHRGSFNLPPGKVKLKLQKPFHRQSNLQDYSAPQGMPNRMVRVRLEKDHLLSSPTLKPVHPMPPQQEPQQTLHRQSPPLPTIVSTHSLHAPFSVDERVPGPNIQANLVETVSQSSTSISPLVVDTPVVSSRAPVDCVKATPETNFRDKGPVITNFIPPPESVTISPELPSSSESANPSLEFVGDPKRNVKVFGNYLMKARQKTKPKYAARYLVRMLFSKETLLCSTMGTCTRGRKALDPNKVSAVREFLASTFTNYDLGEYGRDWKTCVTNVNAMIRSIRCETKRDLGSNEGVKSSADEPQSSICVDSDNSEDDDDDVVSPVSQTATSSAEVKLPNPPLNNVAQEGLSNPSPSKPQSPEPMEFLGSSLRNVQLPFSVIYVAKGKPRPELSARFLIRALFPEDVLVKSNVYGNKERGMAPLDCNKINALRDFLQENYPSFHLHESGFDWKACVAAINSTIRSLRHDHKKASGNPRKSVQTQAPCETGASQKQPPVAPYHSDTITLMD
ncbi:BEN domain-containing protein 2 isoform X2 [Pleurodeles waltl]|uniref:BEN domain-containing protein 2 isoform X2 n=1 Tax=Pleurodeles waltl TaxID=8319 RepID=UPI00370983BE